MLNKILESRTIVFLILILIMLPVSKRIAGVIDGKYKPVVGEFSYTYRGFHKDIIALKNGDNENTTSVYNGYTKFSTKNEACRQCDLVSIEIFGNKKLLFDVSFSESSNYWRVEGEPDFDKLKIILEHDCNVMFNTITTIKGLNAN